MGLTSCCTKSCPYQEMIEIPCQWHTPLEGGMTVEDPYCYRWWETFEDPLLISLIEQAACKNSDARLAAVESKEKLLETVNLVAAEIAKDYIELRGLQMRLQVIHATIEAQNQMYILGEGLSDRGFINAISQNENKKNLDSLLIQKAFIEVSIQKISSHLSTLLSKPPGDLAEVLNPPKDLPELPCNIPVGFPMALIERHPAIEAARKLYELTQDKQAFLHYQKKVLSVLEETENALATFHYELDKHHYLNNIKRLKFESFQLTQDLYNRGLKDDRELLTAQQELLSDENSLIQGKVDLLVSYVNLYQTLSSGWEIDCF